MSWLQEKYPFMTPERIAAAKEWIALKQTTAADTAFLAPNPMGAMRFPPTNHPHPRVRMMRCCVPPGAASCANQLSDLSPRFAARLKSMAGPSSKASASQITKGKFMLPDLNQLRLEQVDEALKPYRGVRGIQIPRGGWLRAVREALGLTVRQQAARLGISVATLHKSERSETEERISLAQLRKLAEGLDCEVVYGLVPRKPLTEVVREQATRIARTEVLGIAHSMSLENQRPGERYLRKQLDQRRAELLSRKWSDLWR